MSKILLYFFVPFFCVNCLKAQNNVDSLYSSERSMLRYSKNTIDSAANIRIVNFIAPAVFISYGILALNNGTLRQLNSSTSAEIQEDHPFFKTHIDNYSQFLPAATVFILQLSGIKGRNTTLRQAAVYATSIAISTAFVTPLKRWTHELRPDGSDYQSFPSGHTATAFASAEFLRIEYGRTSLWISVSGYAVAVATAAYRMYNNKHWFGDVVAGAGFGILSTDLAYWLNDNIFWRKKNASLGIFPVYQDNIFGIGLVKNF